MSGDLSKSWNVLHILYPSLRARRELIANWLPRFASRDNRPWYFVDADIPVAGGSRVVTGLEVSMRSGIDDREEEEEFQASLDELLRRALVTSIARSNKSLAVQSKFFPADVPPECYRDALAVGSRRAVVLLVNHFKRDVEGVPDHVVQAELLYTHRALVPRNACATTLGWHAAWLEHLAGEGEATTFPDRARAIRETSNPHTLVLGRTRPNDSYVGFRAELTNHSKEVAQRIRDVGVEHGWRAENIRAAIVARLAHTQTVRLWGPGMLHILAREAAHLRTLERRCVER